MSLRPGELLREEILPALERPKTEIAKLLGVSRQMLHDMIDEKQPVTPAMALRLGKLFGNGRDLWLNLQKRYDLHRAQEELGEKIKVIPTSGRGLNPAHGGTRRGAKSQSAARFRLKRVADSGIMGGLRIKGAQHETMDGLDVFRPTTTTHRSPAEGRSGVQSGDDETSRSPAEAPGYHERQGGGIIAHRS
jgi:addiction module HigA family antidote